MTSPDLECLALKRNRRDPNDWRESSVILPGTIVLVVIITVFPIIVFGGSVLFEAVWNVMH
jgi:hypothetical protein